MPRLRDWFAFFCAFIMTECAVRAMAGGVAAVRGGAVLGVTGAAGAVWLAATLVFLTLTFVFRRPLRRVPFRQRYEDGGVPASARIVSGSVRHLTARWRQVRVIRAGSVLRRIGTCWLAPRVGHKA